MSKQNWPAFGILFLLFLVVIIPSFALSFFSIHSIQKEEKIHLARLKKHYHLTLNQLGKWIHSQLYQKEKEFYLSTLPFLHQPSSLIQQFVKKIHSSPYYQLPFAFQFTPSPQRLYPYQYQLLLPPPPKTLNLPTIPQKGEELQTALQHYRNLVRLYRNRPNIHLYALWALAKCFEQLGNNGNYASYAEAVRIYKNILHIYPIKKQHQIHYASLKIQFDLALLYRSMANSYQFHKELLALYRFLALHQEAFPKNLYQKWKKKIQSHLPKPTLNWAKKEWNQIEQIAKKKEKIQEQMSALEQKLKKIFSTPFSGKILSYFPNKNTHAILNHFRLSSLYFLLYFPQKKIVLGAFLKEKPFLLSTLQQLQTQQESGVEILLRQQPLPPSLVSLPLPPPLENHYLCALPNPTNSSSLADLQTKNYIFIVITAALTMLLGVLGIVFFAYRQIRNAQLKSDFVSNVTHELKTPLTSIRMFVETILMERVKDRQEEKECLEIINKETERLSRLIEKILDFSALENQIKRFHFVPCQIEELVQNSIEIFKKQIPPDSCSIQLHVLQNIQPIELDKESIHEVLLNLLSNAYKYSENQAKIDVFLKESKHYVIIEVVDNGIGILKKHLKKIFHKFYRIQNLFTTHKEGTGLGLAICRGIIQVHRGKITVESQPGKGSKFSIFLPKKNKKGPPPSPPTKENPSTNKKLPQNP
ncbi:MAG: sensor histidine kinase [Planctomycetota bacterium]|nr:MAG: sensor histidine kinase [Planctomycetota bacterium]